MTINIRRRSAIGWLGCLLLVGSEARALEPQPVASAHPLDPALKLANQSLEFMRNHVNDYTATLIKRERIKGKLQDFEFVTLKARNRRQQDGRVVTPFSVYLKFVHPESVKGREVIYVEGRHDGNLIAHETGLLGFKRFTLPPDGLLAMMGQRYPITRIGLVNLVEELIERGERDRRHGDCAVKFYQGAKVDERVCTLLQVEHPEKKPPFDFAKAHIYIDDELNVPIRYAAWSWPAKPGEELVLEEEYTYRNLKLNVGLTDQDFDPENKEYAFP